MSDAPDLGHRVNGAFETTDQLPRSFLTRVRIIHSYTTIDSSAASLDSAVAVAGIFINFSFGRIRMINMLALLMVCDCTLDPIDNHGDAAGRIAISGEYRYCRLVMAWDMQSVAPEWPLYTRY